MALEQPLAVEPLDEGADHPARLLEVRELVQVQALLLQRPDPALDAAVAFGLPDVARARPDPEPRQLAEELVAELGGSFLTARFGLENVSNAAAYMSAWLKVLRRDSRAVFSTTRLASEAAEYLAPSPSSL